MQVAYPASPLRSSFKFVQNALKQLMPGARYDQKAAEFPIKHWDKLAALIGQKIDSPGMQRFVRINGLCADNGKSYFSSNQIVLQCKNGLIDSVQLHVTAHGESQVYGGTLPHGLGRMDKVRTVEEKLQVKGLPENGYVVFYRDCCVAALKDGKIETILLLKRPE